MCLVENTNVCNRNGECITWYPELFCDGKDDLENGTDEAECCKYLNYPQYHICSQEII